MTDPYAEKAKENLDWKVIELERQLMESAQCHDGQTGLSQADIEKEIVQYPELMEFYATFQGQERIDQGPLGNRGDFDFSWHNMWAGFEEIFTENPNDSLKNLEAPSAWLFLRYDDYVEEVPPFETIRNHHLGAYYMLSHEELQPGDLLQIKEDLAFGFQERGVMLEPRDFAITERSPYDGSEFEDQFFYEIEVAVKDDCQTE